MAPRGFDILDDAAALPSPLQPPPPGSVREALQELCVEHQQNQALLEQPSSLAGDKAHHHQLSPSSSLSETSQAIRAKLARRAPRNRRPPIESETFEPLDAVLEETSLVDTDASVSASSPQAAAQPQAEHPLTALEADCNIQEQVEKHLAGRYEWLMEHPAPTSRASHHAAHDGPPTSETVVYGCNYLGQRRSIASEQGHDLKPDYNFLATPLKAAQLALLEMHASHNGIAATSSQPPPYPVDPLKAARFVNRVEGILSPSVSVVSERSGSSIDDSTRAASVSVARIEDSLEELDKLEEELEAVNAATLPGASASVDDRPATPAPATQPDHGESAVVEIASMASQSATVRMKPTEKTRPSLCRSASLAIRDKKPARPVSAADQKVAATLPRVKSTAVGATTPKPAAKATRPQTVPKFELPGDAVARRLKEQRDARQALQAKLQQAQVSSPKPKPHRPLVRPTFELPGEAISRRKREEREAKLRAEEEEERKRREFKARPVRHSVGPGTLPRDTVASRARQNRGPQDETEAKQAEADKMKRMSLKLGRPTAAAAAISSNNSINKSPPAQGRDSTVPVPMDTSRATSASASTGTFGKRSTLPAGLLEQQRQRGKQVFARDSTYAKGKEQDRRERESTAKLAREQAAERSRIASREWAEKQRRKELAATQPT